MAAVEGVSAVIDEDHGFDDLCELVRVDFDHLSVRLQLVKTSFLLRVIQ